MHFCCFWVCVGCRVYIIIDFWGILSNFIWGTVGSEPEWEYQQVRQLIEMVILLVFYSVYCLFVSTTYNGEQAKGKRESFIKINFVIAYYSFETPILQRKLDWTVIYELTDKQRSNDSNATRAYMR